MPQLNLWMGPHGIHNQGGSNTQWSSRQGAEGPGKKGQSMLQGVTNKLRRDNEQVFMTEHKVQGGGGER